MSNPLKSQTEGMQTHTHCFPFPTLFFCIWNRSLKMKLYLAVAVLLLALATQSEAQAPEEPTPAGLDSLGDKFSQFGDTVAVFGQDIAVKTKDAIQRAQESEFAVNTRTWFSDQMEKMKAKLSEIGQ
ncbi:apolipoprotein C-I [Gadus macrocephalus]|uniref:apolipoprotein C-I n=1 Tax=Gadus macrocephalus TaxID=80720 RepID=UPI0028CBA39D|nr:apolipoprotein C-I [Gadus macrocephalus]